MTGTVLFLYATHLSGSIYGGFIASLFFFFNHTECTRIQWTPPLRESFAYPILMWQMYRVTLVLDQYRTQDPCVKLTDTSRIVEFFDIFIPTVISLACWKFSQFVLMTQVIALLILKWTNIIPKALSLQLMSIHLLAAGINGFLMSQHLFSYYGSLVTSSFYTHDLYIRLENLVGPKMVALVDIIVIISFGTLHKFMFTTAFEDYGHVIDIFKAKLIGDNNFHTLLYTCSPEFDFLPYESYEAIVKTLLLPTAILAGILVLYYWFRNYRIMSYPACIDPGVAYNALQTGAFIIMSMMIMRLKLFMNPHLCLISGLTVSKKYLNKLGIRNDHLREVLIISLIAVIAYNGVDRLQEEGGVYGEYSNIHQEELFEWIKTNTPTNAVFAGQMSIMANLLLSTRRPIVNNPYYESKDMRDRTRRIYEIYSRKDTAAVYDTLRKMHVDYLVLEEGLCYGLGNG